MEVPVVDRNNVFRCKSAGCNGNMIVNYPAEVKLVGCPRCGVFNCRLCNAVHSGMTCRQYQERGNPIQNQPVRQPIVQPVEVNRNPVPVIRPANQPQIIRQVNLPQHIPQQLVKNPKPVVPLPRVQSQTGIHFKCRNGTCPGFLNLRNIENIKLIACPVCSAFNCYPCKAIHNGLNCNQYREKLGLPPQAKENVSFPVKQQTSAIPITSKTPQIKMFMEELRAVDNLNIIPNSSSFDCPVCGDLIAPKLGVVIRTCAHECCRTCLAEMIEHNEHAVVPCINPGCLGTLQDREIRELVTPAIFDKYTKRSLLEAQKCIPNLYMCCTPDCGGMWCVDEENNLPNHRCGMCNKLNCHKCKAVHENMTCKQYKEDYANRNDPNVQATLKALEEQMQRGEIMYCPGCQAIVERDEGCSWIMCPVCKTEICWATRGPRWGPKGNGDTSGGCKCGWKVGGKKCHEDCNYCH